ncbi:unnamed protein product, partial [Mesorhabditis belari]|uniref:Uncharacterized protein n=1 Tax=Mesorhabditis belari TaxID=2138241 RepID=A0AAF3J570_9BILA
MIYAGTTIGHQTDCQCVPESTISQTKREMEEFLRGNLLKLRNSARNLRHSTKEELSETLIFSRHRVLKEIRRVHESLLNGNFVVGPISEFFNDLRMQALDVKLSSAGSWESFLHSRLSSLFSQLFPSVFLCMSFSFCPPRHEHHYVKCLRELANDLQSKLFNGGKLSKAIKETANHFSKVVHLLKTLSQIESLISADSLDSRISPHCGQRMAEVTRCPPCHTKGIKYCRESCLDGVHGCLGNLSDEWNRHVRSVAYYKQALSGEFVVLEDALIDSFAHAGDHSLHQVAQEIVKSCGPLSPHQHTQLHSGKNAKTKFDPPSALSSKAFDLANKFLLYENFWLREGSRLCGEWSTEERCWNGKRLVGT